MTANALGLAIGGPLLTFLTTRLDRRVVLLGSLVVFTLANLVPALVTDYPRFMTARVVVGAAQGLFIAAAFVTATSIVPPERTGRAMAIVVLGFATSSAFGLPLGTLLGQAVGWRWSFAAVVAVGAVVLGRSDRRPRRCPDARDGRAAGQVRSALAPGVLAVLGLSFLIFTAIQSALTYLVLPFLDQVSGVSGALVSAFLLAYGAATAIGSFAGGRFADWNAARSLIMGTIGITLALLALHLFGGNPLLAWLAIFAVGLLGMGMAPSMQHRVTSLAGAGGPLADSLPASAVNAGIAVGSLAGGTAIGYAGVPAGAVIAVVAVAAARATRTRKPAALRSGTSMPWPSPQQPADQQEPNGRNSMVDLTSNEQSVVDQDAFTVRRTIWIAAPVERVWSVVTEPEQISRWFGRAAFGGSEVGADGTLTFEDRTIPIRIEQLDRPRMIAYRWSNDDDVARLPEQVDLDHSTVFTFTLDSVDNGTRLTVVETGFGTLSDPGANLESHRVGWNTELDKLVALLEGGA